MDCRKRHHRRDRHNGVKMSIYVVLSSDSSTAYFADNTPYNFKSHLNAPLILEGTWKVALIEADIISSHSKEDAIYVHSSICQESIVEGEKKPLLRRLISNDPGDWTTLVNLPHYIPVNVKELYDIDIYITDRNGEKASFLNKPSTLTLHFKSFPFF